MKSRKDKNFRYQVLRKKANISSSGLANYNNELKTKNSNFNFRKHIKSFYLKPMVLIMMKIMV